MSDVVIADAATGAVIVRDFTPEEVAQRALDLAAELQAQAEHEQAVAERTAAREAAIARFKSLGFTDEEIAVLVLP